MSSRSSWASRAASGSAREDGSEAAAVERAGAVLLEGLAVLGRGVALVAGEAVLRELLVELAAERVAVDLGDDGGGGDGEAERVAVEEPGLLAGIVDVERVDDEVVGGDGELLAGEAHGEARGLVDVDAVDGLGVDGDDGEGEGHLADLAVELLAVLAVELLGVGEAHAREDADLFRKDDGGGDDGAEERAAADLVDAGDGAEAVVAEGLLGGVGADELLEHLLLGGGFGDALNFGNAEERRHLAAVSSLAEGIACSRRASRKI